MKISIIAKKINWCVEELIKEAKKFQIEVEIVDVKNLDDIHQIKNLGDFIIWRNSSLNRETERTVLMKICENKHLINLGHLTQPMLINKMYQQKIIENHSLNKTSDVKLKGIKTWSCKNEEQLKKMVDKGELKFPFIKKEVFGSRGNGVELIKKYDDIKNINFGNSCVYQNFIKNNGDFRVLVLGGKVLGAIKRISQKGDFRNNISLGAKAEKVKEEEILQELTKISLKVATIFELSFCGIDLIYDENEKNYKILEINSVPWWKGFQETTNVNVAKEVIKFCKSIYNRNKGNPFELIDCYYNDNYKYLCEKKFHFSSRLFMWKKDEVNKQRLLKLKREYIGENRKETEFLIKKLLKLRDIKTASINEKDARMPYFKKYPLLDSYNRILFKVLFSDFLYDYDIKPLVAKIVKKSDMIKLREALEKDKKGLAILSTYAINYIYNLEYYLGEGISQEINPNLFLDIALNDCNLRGTDLKNLKIYLLTHCIINESRFYNRKINRNNLIYEKMLKVLEDIIYKNYFEISLDNKLEFLVCSKILNKKTFLEDIIINEANNSLSSLGNFVIDKHNSQSRFSRKDDFVSGEHRNVLYLMANQNYKK